MGFSLVSAAEILYHCLFGLFSPICGRGKKNSKVGLQHQHFPFISYHQLGRTLCTGSTPTAETWRTGSVIDTRRQRSFVSAIFRSKKVWALTSVKVGLVWRWRYLMTVDCSESDHHLVECEMSLQSLQPRACALHNGRVGSVTPCPAHGGRSQY